MSASAAKVVDRSGIDRAGRADDQERLPADLPVRSDRLFEGCDVDAVVRTGRDRVQRSGAKSCHVESAGNAAMRRRRRVGDERCRAQAVAAHLGAQSGAARGKHGDHVRHGGTGDEHTGRAGRHADHFGSPGDHLALDLDCGMVAATAVHVENAAYELGQVAGRVAPAIDPPHHARVLVGAAVRQDEAPEILVDRRHVLPAGRDRRAQFLTQFVRHAQPDRPVAGGLHPVEHVIEHAMAERACFGPIGGVERVQFRRGHGAPARQRGAFLPN